MDVITQLPLTRLLTARGNAARVNDIGADSIRSLLRGGTLRFAVADIGHALRWIPESDCYDFWKQEVEPHLAEPGRVIRIEQFPNDYAYFASQWNDAGGPIILLAKAH